ncbi:MAG: hypothetical protein ACM3H8_12705 [Sphingobacteriales bacterium]
MIEVFKTNVPGTIEAELIIALLKEHLPSFHINFDLHDCDKILRVKGDTIPVNEIIDIVNSNGFHCSVLE